MQFVNLIEPDQKHFASKADIEILEIVDVPMFDETNDQSNTPVLQEFNDINYTVLDVA